MPATVFFRLNLRSEMSFKRIYLVRLWITSIQSEEYFYQGKQYLSRGTFSIISVNLTDKTYLKGTCSIIHVRGMFGNY